MSSSGGLSSAPNSNSPSVQLKKLKAVSWICSRTAVLERPAVEVALSKQDVSETGALRRLLLRGEGLFELRAADGPGFDEAFAERQQLR